MRFLAFIGFLAIIGAAAAAGFFFGGYYNVAASVADPAIVATALEHVRAASIDHHATDLPPASPSLTDATVVQNGARAYATRGCVNCHGGPGADWAKFSEGLSPGPPDLKDVAPTLEPRELFWVIRHGINMTGMPAFDIPDPEAWTIVAFLKKLPTVSEADFKTWTAAAAAVPAPAKAP
jgi:mono/diheme cytochrome c family protein